MKALERKIKPFQYTGSYERPGQRRLLQEETELRNLKLEEINCPICGKKHLAITTEDELGLGMPKYGVTCDDCDFVFPLKLSDVGDMICQFKTWLSVYLFLGKPLRFIEEDLTLLLFPESYREKKKEYRRGDGWYE